LRVLIPLFLAGRGLIGVDEVYGDIWLDESAKARRGACEGQETHYRP
jgi:hypothetical protein